MNPHVINSLCCIAGIILAAGMIVYGAYLDRRNR